MGARFISNLSITAACLLWAIVLLWTAAKGLAMIAAGKRGGRIGQKIKKIFPQMENKRAETDDRDRGSDRIDHLPQ